MNPMNTRRTLCDSNYGERDISFAPLVAIGHPDGRVTVINTAQPRGRGYLHDKYPSIEEAAEARDFICRWLDDQKPLKYIRSTSIPMVFMSSLNMS